MKEIKDINRWENIPCLWTGRIHTVKMTVLSKATYRFSGIPTKLSVTFFSELGPKNLKICMVTQKTPNNQNNLEKETQSWRNQTP